MSTAGERLAEVRGKIAAACFRVGRDPAEVELVAVSKTFSADAVRGLIESGQRVFGESRQQEAEPKIAALPVGLRWHFIGHLQRNKVRKVLPLFPVIHGVDSFRLACQIDDTAGELGMRPAIYLEVNLAGEASKHGFTPGDLLRSAAEWSGTADAAGHPGLPWPGLRHADLLGLMAIPPVEEDPATVRPWFARLRELRDRLEPITGIALRGLSMGMSADYEVAIEEGATVVRVGSALFGERPVPA